MFGLITAISTANHTNYKIRAWLPDSLIAITVLTLGILAATSVISWSPAASFVIVGIGSTATLYQIHQIVSILKDHKRPSLSNRQTLHRHFVNTSS